MQGKVKEMSLRYVTRDSLPPQLQRYVDLQQVGNETTVLHVNDESVHRAMSDVVTRTETHWSSQEIADEIASGGADQDLTISDVPTFLASNLKSDYNASLYFRRGNNGGPKWTIQNNGVLNDSLDFVNQVKYGHEDNPISTSRAWCRSK